MASDIASHFYASINLPLQERVMEMTRLIEQASPFKDLQALFPQLVASVFGGTGPTAGWGLRTLSPESNPYEFEALHRFLAPQGPMFRLCYKLLADPQLKYSFPLHMLPLDIQQMLERGRYPQFYADLLNIDAQTIHLVSLALNPFDYYIFHFASHLLSPSVTKMAWESWNTPYNALVCDYLTHFLPTDPTLAVAPHIPYYTGKAPVVAPLQTTNRQLHSPSLLLVQDLPGLSSQHSPASPQTQPRNEIWRTETVVQVLCDVWLSIDQLSQSPMEAHSYTLTKCPSPITGERVRVARMLVKRMHAFSSKCNSDPMPGSSALRKCARQTMCLRVYNFIVYLVATWPLDASFRLVLELWLSSIQPWRYTDSEQLNRHPEKFGSPQRSEDKWSHAVDASYTQFVAENLPMYTTIFLQVLPRFMRLDLTAPKSAVMLFRLCKVFAQPNLVAMIREIEMAAMGQNITFHQSTDMNWNMSYNYSLPDVIQSNKWGGIAKQAIAELTPSPNACYQPMWSEQSREMAFELMRKAASAKIQSERFIAELETKILQQNQGFWSFLINFWSSVTGNDEDDINIEERKTVPAYLGTAIQQFAHIYGFDESLVLLEEEPPPPDSLAGSEASFASAAHAHLPPLPLSPQARNKSINVQYMGDPELIPISSFESTVLVRILYQISSRLNEMYQRELWEAWRREDWVGSVCRELLQRPRTIHTYTRGGLSRRVVSESLGPRLSLRRFASYAFLFWLAVGYVVFRLLDYGGFTYSFVLLFGCLVIVCFKATLKHFGIVNRDDLNVTP